MVVLDVLGPRERPLPSLLLTVSFGPEFWAAANAMTLGILARKLTGHDDADQKQARDLVNVLQEAKQQIDPRLAEMARFGGGGGGGRGYGGYGRGRGGGRGAYGRGRGRGPRMS